MSLVTYLMNLSYKVRHKPPFAIHAVQFCQTAKGYAIRVWATESITGEYVTISEGKFLSIKFLWTPYCESHNMGITSIYYPEMDISFCRSGNWVFKCRGCEVKILR